MSRIRTIKPDFWKHEVLSALPEATHMLAAALLNYADDEGFFNANPGLVRSECFPLRDPSVPVSESLQKLAEIGYLIFGSGGDGRRYGRIVKFGDHQVVNRPKASKIKGIVVAWDGSSINHASINDESSREEEEEQGRGREEEQGEPSASSKPKGGFALKPEEEKPIGKGELRARVIAGEAVRTFNASKLTKKQGGKIANVSDSVGFHNRVKQVKRVLRLASEIQKEATGSQVITEKFWSDYWDVLADDNFMAGRTKPGNGHENWKPDFEYFTREATMLKVFERASGGDE